jgi:hypothetical protein
MIWADLSITRPNSWTASSAKKGLLDVSLQQAPEESMQRKKSFARQLTTFAQVIAILQI